MDDSYDLEFDAEMALYGETTDDILEELGEFDSDEESDEDDPFSDYEQCPVCGMFFLIGFECKSCSV